MRTTVRLDEHLLSEVKKYAAETGRTLISVLEDALRDTLARRARCRRGARACASRRARATASGRASISTTPRPCSKRWSRRTQGLMLSAQTRCTPESAVNRL
jgi:predicted transcriptional regulator